MTRCNVCGQDKPDEAMVMVEVFSKKPGTPKWRPRKLCRACHSQKSREHRLKRLAREQADCR